MRTLVIGSGGREHALALALSRDPNVSAVHVAPGNPGAAGVASLHDVDPLDGSAVASLAAELGVDLVVIGPEAPLVAGVADAVRARGIACFGPSAEAAQIEGSKEFAKSVMAAAEVPTGLARVCTSADQVADALDSYGPPYVVKDDRLAGGKGVVVTSDRNTALEHAAQCNQRGSRVLVEEFLAGPEVSLFAVTDGATVVPLLPAQDFKRVGDGDTGPNTGGMGAYTPLPWVPEGLVREVCSRVLQPTVEEMARRGTPFQGLLYAGLVLTERGVKVIEFNARFGDPETQPLLSLLASPLGALLHAAAQGRLDEVGPLRWRNGAAVAVVVAAQDYPDSPRTGNVVGGVDAADALPGVDVVHAGTAFDGQHRLVTAGGRVLAVTAVGANVAEARARAYEGVRAISFEGSHHRTDIAAGI
ncbi:MAG: phosphoribosylamine--glycine ligase [Actinomycetota bacterium]|nr:phosphoribosylamine--glycine ligase [Actinomycetota bacterium]